MDRNRRMLFAGTGTMIAADGDVRFVATIEIPRESWGRFAKR